MKELTLKKLILAALPMIMTSQAYAVQVTQNNKAVDQLTAVKGQYIQVGESARMVALIAGHIPIFEPPM